jgi:hypothetical protein
LYKNCRKDILNFISFNIIIMNDSFEKIGVSFPEAYYRDTESFALPEEKSITIADSIIYDRRLMEIKKRMGFDTNHLTTFLIGGCFSARSIEAMISFMQEINPAKEMKLIVTDLNSEAIKLINKHLNFSIPANITLSILQRDLANLDMESGSVDYIRMDYTQNFIPLSAQTTVLKELHRVLSDNGMVSSIMYILPEASSKLEKVGRLVTKSQGSRVDVSKIGYRQLLLTSELLERTAKKSRFKISYFFDESPQLPNFYNTSTRLAVLEKLEN